MKRPILLFFSISLILVLFNIPANGQLLNENFDYSVGTNLTSVGWIRYNGSLLYPIIVESPGLEYPEYLNSGKGNSAHLIGNSAVDRMDVVRHFESQTSGSVYTFFMVNVHDDSSIGERFLQIGPDTAYWYYFGRVYVRDSSGFLAFGLSKQSPSRVTYTPHIYYRDSTYLLALRYAFNEGSTNDDVVSLWINPAIGGEEPPPDITVSDPLITDASDIGLIALRQSERYFDLLVDGIRVQTSWLKPEFSVDPINISFEDLYVGSVFQDTLTVTNTGETPLEITDVGSDNPVFSIYPTDGIIGPSESNEFYVVFAPTAPGPVNGNITFANNGATSPNVIPVSGTGLAALFSVSPVNIDFGDLMVGSVYQDTVTVINQGNVDLSIASAFSDNPDYTVSPTAGAIGPLESKEFYITFDPSSPGDNTGNVIFLHNGLSSVDTVKVTGRGLAPLFSVIPTNVDFGDLYVGSINSDTVIVTNTGTQVLTISSVTSDNSEFTVSPTTGTIAPSASREFYIQFSPTSGGLKSGNIVFNHNGLSVRDSVAVTGQGIISIFTVTPVNLDFGDLYVGDIYSDTVTVTNNGSATLLITSVVSTNSDFTVNPTSASLSPSSSRIFIVTFAPSSSGLKTGDIVFNHNGPTDPDTVTVSGTGVDFITIADARAKPDGETVIIQGIITRAVGRVARIQDGTGGLSLQQASGAFYDSLQSGGIRPGDIVKIRGVLSEVSYLRQFEGAGIISFNRISRDNPLPTPQEITLAELAANGENYESELVTVLNLTADPDGDLNFVEGKLYAIKDPSDTSHAVGLQIPIALDTDIEGLPIPLVTFSFTGVVGQFSVSDPAAGYHLLAVLENDVMPLVDVKESELIPTEFALKANYPNPFNPSTEIGFDIPKATIVNLIIYNALGQKVAHLINNEPYEPGRYGIRFNAENLASGIYFYKILTPEFTNVRKMIFAK